MRSGGNQRRAKWLWRWGAAGVLVVLAAAEAVVSTADDNAPQLVPAVRPAAVAAEMPLPERPPATAEGQGRAGPKYSKLLRTVRADADQQQYGEYYDYGYSATTAWAGQQNLPPGYWVYIAPNWYIFGQISGAVPPPVAVAAKRSWGPEQACGPPDTPEYGDVTTAWASRTADGPDEWLRLHYDRPVRPSAVHIYETYNPGAVDRITATSPSGTEVELWRGQDPVPQGNAKGTAKIAVRCDFDTQCITIYLKSSAVPGWNEIDAVGLLDQAEKVHWATAAEASSTYADLVAPPPSPLTDRQRIDRLEQEVAQLRQRLDALPPTAHKRSWGPEQACGPPDTQFGGDYATAWASKTEDGQDEWLGLYYSRAVVPTQVQVYETYCPGALFKITARKPTGEYVEIWSGQDPVPQNSPGGVAKIDVHCTFATNAICLWLKSKDVKGWNEIDAVGLVDNSGTPQWAVWAEASSTFASGEPVAMPTELIPHPAAGPRIIIQEEEEERLPVP